MYSHKLQERACTRLMAPHGGQLAHLLRRRNLAHDGRGRLAGAVGERVLEHGRRVRERLDRRHERREVEPLLAPHLNARLDGHLGALGELRVGLVEVLAVERRGQRRDRDDARLLRHGRLLLGGVLRGGLLLLLRRRGRALLGGLEDRDIFASACALEHGRGGSGLCNDHGRSELHRVSHGDAVRLGLLACVVSALAAHAIADLLGELHEEQRGAVETITRRALLR
mmetsp:Transcript_22185/g.53229  ORF Transcript_22185/g.53229 Transcript_22185/m.53229 type:complete len:226 (+) Transcript_22185:17-694(+)